MCMYTRMYIRSISNVYIYAYIFIGLVIEYWKVLRTLQWNTTTNTSATINSISTSSTSSSSSSSTSSSSTSSGVDIMAYTAQLDSAASSHLVFLAAPLMAGYSLYSLAFHMVRCIELHTLFMHTYILACMHVHILCVGASFSHIYNIYLQTAQVPLLVGAQQPRRFHLRVRVHSHDAAGNDMWDHAYIHVYMYVYLPFMPLYISRCSCSNETILIHIHTYIHSCIHSYIMCM
jgi:hypothetical protein